MSVTLNPGQQRALDEVLTSGARFCLVYGGSRSGKTFLFCKSIAERAYAAPGSRHLIVRKTAKAAKDGIALDTFPKMHDLCFGFRPRFKAVDSYFELPNGSEVWIGGLDDQAAMEKVLGREYATIYENEASEIPYAGHLLLRSRLAQTVKRIDGEALSQRCYIDLNPTNRAHWTYRLFVDGNDPDSDRPVERAQYAYGFIQPKENAANLDVQYLADLETLPERQRRRFFLGEFAGDAPNALWQRKFFRRVWRKDDGGLPAEFKRVIVAVDPAASNTATSDETGIVVAAVDYQGRGYILADESGRYAPDEWARKVVAAYQSFDADRVIAEVNNGGDMVEAVIRAHAPTIPFTAVHATRGKVVRAEPIAALYELGKVMHLGELTELEDQMCSVESGFDPKVAGWSPDRVDAAVWALTELFPQVARPEPVQRRRNKRGGSWMAE